MDHKILRRGALLSCVLLVCYTLHVPISTAASSLEQNTSLLWSFVVITGTENQRKLMPVRSDTVLYSGDKFKLMFEARETLFVYIIFAGSEGETQSVVRSAVVGPVRILPCVRGDTDSCHVICVDG